MQLNPDKIKKIMDLDQVAEAKHHAIAWVKITPFPPAAL
jgi:hypothetical protein